MTNEAILTTAARRPEAFRARRTSHDNARAKFVPSFKTADPLERAVARAEFMDNAMVHVGGGGLRAQTVERTASAYLQQWENGARWTIHTRPQWWRAYDHYPLRVLADLESVTWPDPDDPARYAGVAEKVRYFSGRGYFCQGSINGFFSGVWYFWRPFEEFLVELVEQPRLAHALVDRVGEFNLRMAQHLLECGVHAISFPDDLGYNTALFISPHLYQEFFYPWHRRVAELCHSHGAYVNMHSHGNLNAIMPLLVEAGIDILNPVGPSDGMNLAEPKAFFGGYSVHRRVSSLSAR
jgi:hypothetical protein